MGNGAPMPDAHQTTIQVIVTRWIRIVILAVLLPAYGFAAVHVDPYPTPVATEKATGSASGAASDDDGDNSLLLFELGDTSDDVCDHCIPYTFEVKVVRARSWSPSIDMAPAPDAIPRRLLRPPRAFSR